MTALIAIALPLLAALLIPLLGKRPNWRDAATLIVSAMLFAVVASLAPGIQQGERPGIEFPSPIPSAPFSLLIEPLGLLFALVASALWIITTIYAIGYMRGNKEQHQTRFFFCFAIAITATMGIAFSGNLLTLFFFYEALTLSTYPLVTHKGTEAARRGGRMYLGILLVTSIGFLLPAILWTWHITGTLSFEVGGILAGKIDGTPLSFLLVLYLFGIGKAALMPFHRWLPSAMVAPTPVSALLHAVAVVKAGVFSVMKIAVYVFGIDLLSTIPAADIMMWVAATTILLSSCIAIRKDNLKARLAYSTISQLSYIVLAATLATRMSIAGGCLHIAMHAMGKITLFFCAGAIYTATHKTEISDMDGLGRVMPITYTAFLLGALSIIGLPPMGGAWSKWYLMLGALDAGHVAMVVVLAISSLLNIAYLLSIVARGFFLPLPNSAASELGKEESGISREAIKEAPGACVLPLCITAAGTILLFLLVDPIYEFIITIL